MKNFNWDTSQIPNQKGRVIIVTGSTSGIGRETARVLAEKGAIVILAVRNTTKGDLVATETRQQYPSANIHPMKLDLSSQKSVHSFVENFMRKFSRLDVLINNAGVMFCPYSKTEDGFELQIGTNHFGHFALTGLLMPLLKKTERSRIVALSSTGIMLSKIDLDDLNWEKRKYNPQTAYGDSKIANLYFTYELARRLESEGSHIKVTAAHPGWTATDLQRHSLLMRGLNKVFAQDVDMGALPTLRAGFDDGAKSGEFYGPNGRWHWKGYPAPHKSTELSYNRSNAKRLWEISEWVTGVKF